MMKDVDTLVFHGFSSACYSEYSFANSSGYEGTKRSKKLSGHLDQLLPLLPESP